MAEAKAKAEAEAAAKAAAEARAAAAALMWSKVIAFFKSKPGLGTQVQIYSLFISKRTI